MNVQQKKIIVFSCLLTIGQAVMSVHADPILRAGNRVSYIVNRNNQGRTWGFGMADKNQMFKWESQSKYSKGTIIGHRSNHSCISCHIIGTQDVAPSKVGYHVLVYGTGKHMNAVIGYGSNTQGQLGNSNSPDFTNYHDIPAKDFYLGSKSTTANGCGAGTYSSFVIQYDGAVKACGDNTYGQLGDGTTTRRKYMVDVLTGPDTKLKNIKSVVGGYGFTLFISKDNKLYVCGRNNHKQLGMPGTFHYATYCKGGVAKADAGYYHSILLMTNGDVYTAGQGKYGAVATGSTSDSYYTRTRNMCIDIAAGGYHSICLRYDPDRKTQPYEKIVNVSGMNTYGQLGNGTTTNWYSWGGVCPDIDLVAAGDRHTLIWRKSDNTFWTCGRNDYGQLGNGTSGGYKANWQPVQFE